MSTNGFAARVSRGALRGALVAMMLGTFVSAARAQAVEPADTPSADAPKPSSSTVEVGGGDVGAGSFKAGEYNGLENKGAFLVGNVNLRDHEAYDSTSALRWSLKGTDLGLDTRNVTAEVRVQGKFRVRFVYDELLRNQSDSYQTPYNGTGTNVLTLPSTWQVPTVAGSTSTNSFVNVVSARGLIPLFGTSPYIDLRTASPTFGGAIVPNAAQVAQVNAAASADLAAFHTVNLFTKRTKFDVGGTYQMGERWAVDVDFQPEHKDGLKPMGTVSANTGGDISTVIADKIDTDTDQVSANVNFKAVKGFAQMGYYGSFFTNHVPFMSWQNWATGPTGTGTVNVMSSTPSNEFNQVNGSVGYDVSRVTKIVANGSYGRTTQNDTFLTDASTPVVPVTSLHGLVVSTLFNAKLTAKPTKKLNLAAGYRYENRDNRTPINIYQYADAGAAPAVNANFPAGPNNPLGAVVAQNANANRPYSRLSNLVTLAADYAVAKRQWIKAGYDYEQTDRSCPGAWIDCADAPVTNESTLRAEWRASGDALSVRVAYAYAARRVPTYNENAFLALVPYANISPATAISGATALSFMNANGWNGWGPALGYAATTGNMNLFFPSNNALANTTYANNNRISELPGMERSYEADRNRNTVRTALDWQASDALSFDAGVDLNNDDYPTSGYGVQSGKSWALNLDGTYAINASTSADVFYTYENQRSLTKGNSYTANSNTATITGGQAGVVGLSGNSCDMFTTLQQRNNNNKLDPCLDWSANMLTHANTAGLGLTKKAGRTDLTGNLVLMQARWDNSMTGGNWANNILDGPGSAPTTVAAFFIPATSVPTVTTNTIELRLNGKFEISARQSLRLAYAYLRMTSADFAYEGMQIGAGTITGVLPTNEQPFNYNVNLASVSYILGF